jgi:hypothetical protein
MFGEMRVALNIQRTVPHNRRFRGEANPPKPLMVRGILYCATMGARALRGP